MVKKSKHKGGTNNSHFINCARSKAPHMLKGTPYTQTSHESNSEQIFKHQQDSANYLTHHTHHHSNRRTPNQQGGYAAQVKCPAKNVDHTAHPHVSTQVATAASKKQLYPGGGLGVNPNVNTNTINHSHTKTHLQATTQAVYDHCVGEVKPGPNTLPASPEPPLPPEPICMAGGKKHKKHTRRHRRSRPRRSRSHKGNKRNRR